MKFNNPQEAVRVLEVRLNKFNEKVKTMVEYNAAQMENASKQNAPWTDRTGNARNSIYAFVEENGKTLELLHGIGMEYGKYLEVSNQGKFRIIKPTVDNYTPRIKKDIINLGV
jgi:hypothetical protein